jgi:dihydrofolate synthase/folylpolyglutamate synthase
MSARRARAVTAEEILAGLARFGWHLGLDRIEGLLLELGHPEAAYPAVQIAGTNGKGSTAAQLAAILASAGYRIGLYTSPHLERYEERFALLDGRRPGAPRRLIAPRRLASLLRRVALVADDVGRGPAGPPTEFEVLTAAAVLWFTAERVDLAVLETGLGGRLDATTAVPAVLTVLTHIDLDHTDRLGDTLAAIAGEKAAIIRPGQPVVMAPQAEEALVVIARRAAEQGAPLIPVVEAPPAAPATSARGEHPAAFAVETVSLTRTSFTYFPPRLLAANLAGGPSWPGVQTPLAGRHQAANAATALTAALALGPLGFTVSEEAARRGLGRTRWPGRLEVLRRRPLILVDGAHNPDGMRRLVEAWGMLAPGVKPLVVCGFLRDKAVDELTDLLAPLAGRVITTRPDSDRAAAPEEVAARFAALGVPARSVADPAEAARVALAEMGRGGALLGCGSLYLIGALRRAWRPGRSGPQGVATGAGKEVGRR